jgi:hypothetical protein
VEEYSRVFPQVLPSSEIVELNEYTLLPPHASLTYDATMAFLQAFDNTKDKNSQDDFDNALATVEITGVDKDSIVFNGKSSNHSSDPNTKSVYVLCTDHNHIIQVADASKNNYPSLKNVQQCS